MNVRTTEFRVQEGQKVDLHKWATAVEPIYESKKQYQKLLKKHVEELSSLQQLLYASSRYALLLIFHAMDAAGKDGVIKARCLDVTVFHPASDRFARRTAKFDRGWGYRNPSLVRPQATGSFVRSAAKLHRGSAGPPARKAGQLRGLSVIRPIGKINFRDFFGE